MANIHQSNHTKNINPLLLELMPAIHFLLLFMCSSAAAWLLYGILSSTGIFESKGIQLGGAAAGFVVIFGISHKILTSLSSQQTDRFRSDIITTQHKQISELNDTIRRLRSGELPPVDCPVGYTPIISKDNSIALLYPSDWLLSKEKTVAAFFRPLEKQQLNLLKFQGNIWITSTPLTEEGIELLKGINEGAGEKKIIDLALRLPAVQALKYFGGKNDPLIEHFSIGKRMGVRCRGTYPRKNVQGSNNYFDCITVIDEQTNNFFIFAMHECEEFADASVEIFLRVVSSAVFLS